MQRHMGHASPETTAAIYDHSELEVFLPEFGKALAFLPPPPSHAVPMQSAAVPVGEGPPRLLTVKKVASILGVSAATVYKHCETGLLRHVRVSDHSIRVTEADLADFLARRTNQTKRSAP